MVQGEFAEPLFAFFGKFQQNLPSILPVLMATSADESTLREAVRELDRTMRLDLQSIC